MDVGLLKKSTFYHPLSHNICYLYYNRTLHIKHVWGLWRFSPGCLWSYFQGFVVIRKMTWSTLFRNGFRQLCHIITLWLHFMFTAFIHSLVIISVMCCDRTYWHVSPHITTYLTSLSRRNPLFWSQPLFLSLLTHSAHLYAPFLGIGETMILKQRAIVTSQHLHIVIIWTLNSCHTAHSYITISSRSLLLHSHELRKSAWV